MEENINVAYGIYQENGHEHPRAYYRGKFNQETGIMKVWKPMNIPQKLLDYLRTKYYKKIFYLKYWKTGLPFTVGYQEIKTEDDYIYKLWTVAVLHPKDNFNKKIGRMIVTGRIKKLGEVENYCPIYSTIERKTPEK